MKNKQKLDGLQWIGVICFSLAFPVFMIGVINGTVGFAVDGILLVGSGAALPGEGRAGAEGGKSG